MRRDQDITVTKNNSQTDLVVVQDGETLHAAIQYRMYVDRA